MPLVLNIDITGREKIELMLKGVQYRGQDLRPVWAHVSNEFGALMASQFESEGAATGGRWPDLSPAYAAWKARNYPGAKILELTGALRDSLAHRGPGHIDERTPDSVKLGTSVPYGVYHMGSHRTRPARPPLRVPQGVTDRWAKAIHAYLMGGDAFAAMGPTSIFG